MLIDFRRYQPPGPVAARFINSQGFVDGIMGPIRSGKTTAALYKRLTRAMRMPVCRDGVRRYACVIIRDSYGALYETTIRSWWAMFPKELGSWSGSEGRPATHDLTFDTELGKDTLQLRMRFVSIQNDSIENLLRGTEFTDALLEEADLLPEHVLTYVKGRVSQWPKREMLPAGVSVQGLVDIVTNPPDVDSWFYKIFVEDPLPHHNLFQQPSGLSAQAENLANINGGRSFYEMQEATTPPWYSTRMVHGRFGYSRDGAPVYEEFDDAFHVAPEPLKPADCPLRLGFDQNLVNPACVVSQWMPSSQWRVVREILPGRCGASAFGAHVRDVLRQDFRGLPIAQATADPAAAYGADQENGDLAWYETVQRAIGVPVSLAPSQEIGLRHDAVRQFLRQRLPNGEPMFLLSRACPVLRKGFVSHYRFKRQRNDPTAPLQLKPEKNGYSDPHDALQYDMLNSRGRMDVVAGRVDGRPAYGVPRQPAGGRRDTLSADFNVWDV